MNRLYGTILLIFIIQACINGQNNQGGPYFLSGSEIALDVQKSGDIVYLATLDKGLTIYQLSRIFRIEPDKIYKLNGLQPNATVPAGSKIAVPVPKERILPSLSPKADKIPYLRLMYAVKPGETLFRVSKVYFGQDIQEVKMRNNLRTDQIGAGDLLLMGYWMLDKPVAQNAPVVTGKGLQSLEGMKLQVSDVAASASSQSNATENSASEIPENEWVSRQAIGYWDKSNKMTKSLYVLHNEAKIGSEMELYFPLVRSTVTAKVVGRIPEGTYAEDIALYVSPKVARQLGVLDPRFQVNIKYQRSRS